MYSFVSGFVDTPQASWSLGTIQTWFIEFYSDCLSQALLRSSCCWVAA